MPRTEARIKTSRNRDADWLALPMDCQWLYDTFLSQDSLNHAGVLPIPRRMWSNQASDEDAADRIAAALKILVDRQFVAYDDDTDELLIRTYIRHDVLDGPPGPWNAAMGYAQAVRSPRLRAVLHAELDKIDREVVRQKKPGRGAVRPFETYVQALAALNPNPAPPGDKITDDPAERPESRDRPVDKHPMAHGTRYGISNGIGHALGEGEGEGEGESPLVVGLVEGAARATEPSDDDPQPAFADTIPGLLVGLPSLPTEAPRCRVHAKLPPDVEPGKCIGCQKSRERWERQVAEQRAARAETTAAVRASCTNADCDDGWLELPPVHEHAQARTIRCPDCNPSRQPRAI